MSKKVLGMAVLATLAVAVPAAPAAAGADAPGAERAIVVLKQGVSADGVAAAHGLRPTRVYRHALSGFAVPLTPGTARALERDTRVAFIEPDRLVTAFAQTVPTGIQRIFAPGNPTVDIDGTDDLRVDVDVAVVDTGIRLDHADLNVVASTNCTGGSPISASCGSGGGDDNGHGTHVAGTIAALDNDAGVVGVAPGARLHAVKVLGSNGSGYMSWIVAGIDWVAGRSATIEVANMSFGCECSSSALNAAVSNLVGRGVAVAAAAGNSGKNASTFSPANHADVLTVSALADFDGKPGGLAGPTCRADTDDTLANFSNFGATVEIAAPGVCILSTWHDGGYRTASGTSMAAPHAAGGLALLASGSGRPTSRAQVQALYSTLVSSGNLNWTDTSGDGIKERLLDVGSASVFAPATVPGPGGGEPEPPPPPSSIQLSASGYKVKGVNTVALSWSGATSTSVDVYRNGTRIVTTPNDGAHTDSTGTKGGATFTYRVCNQGTSTCSADVTVRF